MSKPPPRIHVACEGPTDFIVIRAAIAALMDSDFILTQIQPETSLYAGDAGPHGGGWKGVRSWCQARVAEAGSLSASSALFFSDVLIIHVDADIADDPEINCQHPCPPCCDTTNALRSVMLGWMHEPRTPKKVVFCTPSQNTEAWVLAAVYPDDRRVNASLECRPDPEAIIVSKPAAERLVRRQSGRYRKDQERYRAQQTKITQNWPCVRKICTEAERFSKEISCTLRPGGLASDSIAS